MASKKSKILAIAFCAAVMSGIYVNPVLAGEYNVQDGTGIVQMPIEDEDGNKVGDVQINNIASQNDLKDETAAREEADAQLASDIKNETLDREQADTALGNRIDEEIQNRTEADTKLQENINAETAAREEADAQLASDIKNETLDREQADTALGNRIDEEIQNRTEADTKLQGQINDVNTVTGAANKGELDAAYSGTNYIEGSASMVEADRRLDAAISDVSTRVDGIENRVDGLEDRIDKVGAMSAAIANLRTMGYDPAAPTEVAVGVGQYRDETGMALGLFHYPNRDFMLSLSVSTSGDEYMGGIGATWKFGRKSPEKVAEIKKAQAEADARRAEEQKLAKAEEMKKAAKEAKVQAQMERHAKMLAEQEAQA